MSLVVSMSGASGFWLLAGLSIALYLLYLGIFFIFQKNALGDKKLLVARPDFNFKPRPTNAIVIVLAALCCLTAFILLQFASLDFFYYIKLLKESSPFVIQGGFGGYVICVLAMCIMPAVIEELLFRGVIFKSLLARKGQHAQIIAVLLSALLFAVFHLNPAQLVYQFILGIIFALMYLKTGNILYPMLAHFINNFFVITYTFIAGSDYMPYSWSAMTIVTAILLAFGGATIIMGLIKVLKKERNADK